jgi:group II intron maturase
VNPFRRGRPGVRIPGSVPLSCCGRRGASPSAGVPTARGGVVTARTRFSILKGGRRPGRGRCRAKRCRPERSISSALPDRAIRTLYPSKKALASVIGKVRSHTRRNKHRTLAALLRKINPVLRGWSRRRDARRSNQVFELPGGGTTQITLPFTGLEQPARNANCRRAQAVPRQRRRGRMWGSLGSSGQVMPRSRG